MRNHEVTPGDVAGSPYHPGQAPPPEAYDPEGTGGVTRLVLDRETLELQRSNLVLAGTYWNCAGGISPWGWLSCEEFPDHPRHGYVFLCATDAETVQAAASRRRLRAHASRSRDGRSGHAHRLSHRRSTRRLLLSLRAATTRIIRSKARCKRCAIAGQPQFDTASMAPGERLPVDWVDVDDPDSADDSIRMRSQARGAARVFRGEGLWLGDEEAFFCATQGGRLGKRPGLSPALRWPAVDARSRRRSGRDRHARHARQHLRLAARSALRRRGRHRRQLHAAHHARRQRHAASRATR